VADAGLSERAAARSRLHPLAWPWWAQSLAIFALTRIPTTWLLLDAAGRQQANPFTGAAPGYAEFATIWDGAWYERIAEHGYPGQLPVDEAGHVGENAWAFMPVYPAVVRLLMLLTGLPYDGLAVAVAVACGAGAAVVLHRLLLDVLPAGTAAFAVLLFCVAPVSPLLQLGYAESMFALLLGLALLLVQRGRLLPAFPVVAVLAITRPGALPLALALVLVWLLRHRRQRREGAPFPAAERWRLGALAVWSGCWGLVWLVAAAIGTGSPTAYTDTELAWRSAYIGRQELVPFTPWFQGAQWWTDDVLGPVALLLLLALVVVALLSPAVRRLGPLLVAWTVSYGLYLLAVWFPQSSTFRILLPAFPALGAVAGPRSPWVRVPLVAACLAGQWLWIQWCWLIVGADWTVP
jgi:hypothetical protein